MLNKCQGFIEAWCTSKWDGCARAESRTEQLSCERDRSSLCGGTTDVHWLVTYRWQAEDFGDDWHFFVISRTGISRLSGSSFLSFSLFPSRSSLSSVSHGASALSTMPSLIALLTMNALLIVTRWWCLSLDRSLAFNINRHNVVNLKINS